MTALMRSTHKQVTTFIIAILIPALAIVFSFFNTTKALAKNTTFIEFSGANYPDGTAEIAKEIAYYAHYVLPLVATSDPGCLGSRVSYGSESQSTEGTADWKSYHVNRCSQLHASDYARLNYIFALNANLPKDRIDKDHLRYLHKHRSGGVEKIEYTDGSGQPKTIELKKEDSDDDEQYLKKLARSDAIDGTTIRGQAILPSALDDPISYLELSKLFVPNVDLTVDGHIFGFDTNFNRWEKKNDQAMGDFTHYSDMYYGALNKTLRSCGQLSDSVVSVKSDVASNSRAFILNGSKSSSQEEVLNNLKKCKDDCGDNVSDTSSCLGDRIDDFLLGLDYSGAGKEIPRKESENYNESKRGIIGLLLGHGVQTCSDVDSLDCRNGIQDKLKAYIPEDARTDDDEFVMDRITDDIVNAYLTCDRVAHAEGTCKDQCDAKYQTPNSLGEPTCAVLVSVLRQVDHPDDSAVFVNNLGVEARWLPLTDTEKVVMQYGDDDLLKNNKGGNEVGILFVENHSTCYFTGFRSIICTFTNFLSYLMDMAFNIIEPMVKFPGQLLGASDGAGETNLFTAWKTFRDIANIVLTIVLLVSVVSQITGWKIASLGIKNNIPRIIAAAILVNISFFICQFAVDLSNLVGSSIRGLFQNGQSLLFEAINLPTGEPSTLENIVASVIGVVAAGAVLLTVVTNLVVLIPVIIGGLLTAITTVLTLSMRHVFIVILILTSPIMFALFGTTATSKYTARWWKMLTGTLMVYPTVSLAFSVGKFAYDIIIAANSASKDVDFINIIAIALLFLPLLLVPSILKKSISAIPMIGDKLNNLASSLPKGASNKLGNTALVQSARINKARQKAMDSRGLSRPNKFLHPLRAARSKLNRPDVSSKNPLMRGYSKAYESLYKNKISGQSEVDSDWMETIKSNMYRYGNGDVSLERIRNYNNGGAGDTDDMIANLMTISDDGAGYFEDVMIAVGRIQDAGIEPQNMEAIMKKVTENYAKNARSEVVSLLKDVQDNKNDLRYESLSDFQDRVSATDQKEMVKRELMNQNKGPSSMQAMHKFVGFDNSTSVAEVNRKHYDSKVKFQSSQAGMDAIEELCRDSDIFNRYMINNIPHMTKKGKDFISPRVRL